MIPDPLHPAVVHLPIALAVLAPWVALAALVSIRRGWLPARTWLTVVALHALLAGSAWLAVETGEQEEERVERVVAERPIETHEERAEVFLGLSLAALAAAALGMLRGRAGRLAQVGTLVAALAVLVSGAAVGHTGGELVYRHGAGQAYATGAAGAAALAPRAALHREPDRDD